MIIIVILASVVLISFLLIRRAMYGGFASRLRSSIDAVLAGVWLRLRQHYTLHYGADTAGLLAAAVVNRLFLRGTSPYEQANPDVVAHELAAIQLDKETRIAITQAARALAVATFSLGDSDPLALFTSLTQQGLIESTVPLSGPTEFHALAAEYLARSKALVEASRLTRA